MKMTSTSHRGSPITISNHCAKDRIWGSQIHDNQTRALFEKWIHHPLDNNYSVPNYMEELQPWTFTGICGSEIICCILLLAWIGRNIYIYGVKQRFLCSSFLLASFYVVATLNVLNNMALAIMGIVLSWDM